MPPSLVGTEISLSVAQRGRGQRFRPLWGRPKTSGDISDLSAASRCGGRFTTSRITHLVQPGRRRRREEEEDEGLNRHARLAERFLCSRFHCLLEREVLGWQSRRHSRKRLDVYIHMTKEQQINNQDGVHRDVPDWVEFLDKYAEKSSSPEIFKAGCEAVCKAPKEEVTIQERKIRENAQVKQKHTHRSSRSYLQWPSRLAVLKWR
jgi:hypothetical protein